MIEKELKFIKISETYIKFNFEFNEANKEIIKNAYLQQIGYSSKDYIRNKEILKISIEYDEGSLKTRIIIWGTSIYMGIANYGSFKTGVRELIIDSKNFSEMVIRKIDDDPFIAHNDIIRSEKRTGLPGRIQDLYMKINKLEKNLDQLSHNQVEIEIKLIKQEVANLYYVLPILDKEEFILELNNDYRQNLPEPDESRVHYLINRYGLKPEEETEFLE